MTQARRKPKPESQLPSSQKSGADSAARAEAAAATTSATQATPVKTRGLASKPTKGAGLTKPAKAGTKARVTENPESPANLKDRRGAASETPARGYHHGNLREALVAAAVQIIDNQGLEQLSVREAAKRAGVSPGAPFRHFASRAALLAAVAEQATQRLHEAMQQRLQATATLPALARFAAIGQAYLEWARCNPTHFRLISDRHAFDHASAPEVGERNQAIRDTMAGLLHESLGPRASEAQVAQLQLMARALVYGLARMDADGHFPEWRLDAPAQLSTDKARANKACKANQEAPTTQSTGQQAPGTQALDAFVQLLAQPGQAMR